MNQPTTDVDSEKNRSFTAFDQQVLQSLREWHTTSPESHPWQQLALFVSGSSLRTSLNRILLTGLEELSRHEAQSAQLLRLRFADDLTAQMVANRLNVVEGTVYKWQRDGVDRLAETLWRLEVEARSGKQQQLEKRLPSATYTQLFGVDRHLQSLADRVLTPGPPWLLAVESMGGMGKTSLAQAVCRTLIRQSRVYDLGWVTAQQQTLSLGGIAQPIERPALTSAELVQALAQQLLADAPDYALLSLRQKEERLTLRLRATPHLVVIDNLETLTDVDALLAHLRGWSNPTKFLLTTRHRLLDQADIHHFVLPELGQADAIALMRHEAQLRNLPAAANASDDELGPIYDAVGGNPLALRLVVGQLHIHPLPTILGDLRRAQGGAVTGLYTHVYWQVWQALSEDARQVLLAMPLVPPDGGDLELLATISHLPPDALRDGLAQLVQRNLVDARGDLRQRLYSIHSLTRTFLHQQVLRWAE